MMARFILNKWVMAIGLTLSTVTMTAVAQPQIGAEAAQQIQIQYAQYDGLKIYKKPSLASDVLGDYTLNNPVLVIRSYNSQFYEVKYETGKAYVEKIYVSKTPYFVQALLVKVPSYDTLNVRKGPGVSYGKLGTLKNNAPLYITSTENAGNWIQVWYKGSFGYVHKAYTKTPPVYVVKVASNDTLNVRTGPGVQYERFGALYPQDTVQVLQKTTAKWYEVYHRGQIGYVSAAYIVKK